MHYIMMAILLTIIPFVGVADGLFECSVPFKYVDMTIPASIKFTTYQKGGEAQFSWVTNMGPFGCWAKELSDVKLFKAGLQHTTTLLLSPSEINVNFYKLNDDVDVQLNWLQDGVFYPFPFEAYYLNRYLLITQTTSRFIDVMAREQSRGIMKLKLRRDIIGGFVEVPAGINLANDYIGESYSGMVIFSPQLLYTFVSRPQIIPVPTQCVINQNQLIDINLGDINSDWLAITSQKQITQQKLLSVQCSGGLSQQSFTAGMKLVGSTANFTAQGQTLLMSNQPDVGLLLQLNQQPLAPQGPIATFAVDRGQGQATLAVTPLKRLNSQPPTGEFTANATLVLSLP